MNKNLLPPPIHCLHPLAAAAICIPPLPCTAKGGSSLVAVAAAVAAVAMHCKAIPLPAKNHGNPKSKNYCVYLNLYNAADDDKADRDGLDAADESFSPM